MGRSRFPRAPFFCAWLQPVLGLNKGPPDLEGYRAICRGMERDAVESAKAGKKIKTTDIKAEG